MVIVDDSAEDSHTFRRYLERNRDSAYTCYVAGTVAEGLDLCRSVRPDAILLDYRLPDDSGLAFLAALIAEHGPLAFAMVMLTGSGDEAVAVQALKLGAQDYLIKEHTTQQRLLLAVVNAISKVHLLRQVKKQLHDLETSNRQLLRSEAQFKTLVEHATDVIARFDRELRHVYVSPAIERASGIAPASYIGKTNRELGGDDALCQLWETHLQRVFETGHKAVLEFALPAPEGMLYFQSTLIPELSADGAVDTVMSIAHDVTVYKQAEARMRFLSEASKALTTSLDYHTILEQMARLAIPQLGDACMLDVLGEQQDTRTLVITHIDQEQETLLRTLCSQSSMVWSDTPPVTRVRHSGQSVLINEHPQEINDIYAGTDEQQALIQ